MMTVAARLEGYPDDQQNEKQSTWTTSRQIGQMTFFQLSTDDNRAMHSLKTAETE